MTKIQFCSDLHLEFDHTIIIPNAGADVLVLAGDICMAKYIEDDIDFFEQVSKDFKDIIYVMGNHEHYRYLYNDVVSDVKKALEAYPNIHVLNNESIVINGVKFIGSTLWTDMNKGDPMTLYNIRHMMSDYQIIKYRDNLGNYYTLRPENTYAAHQEAVHFIEEELNIDDMPVVVVTHHSPSLLSIHSKYKDEKIMNGGYSSDLSHMFNSNLKLWIHGHTHHPFDYMVMDTRVVCNPHGYPNEHDVNFNPEWVVDI
jgi:predicted phosphodiesterase